MVSVTNGTSLAEIVADAGVRFDGGAEQLAAALRRLLDDPAECDRLRALGLRRAASFSYEEAARATIAVLRAAANP